MIDEEASQKKKSMSMKMKDWHPPTHSWIDKHIQDRYVQYYSTYDNVRVTEFHLIRSRKLGIGHLFPISCISDS